MPQKLAKCSIPPQTHHGSMLVWCLAHLALCNPGLEIIPACLMPEGYTAMTPLPVVCVLLLLGLQNFPL